MVPPANPIATSRKSRTGMYSFMTSGTLASGSRERQGWRSSMGVERAHRFGQRGHHLERVADDAVVGHLEDRRVRVLVDGHDAARRRHPGEVLDRARDRDRDVEPGRDRLPGLADL